MERGKLPEISPPAWPQPATARLTNHPLPNRGFLELPYDGTNNTGQAAFIFAVDVDGDGGTLYYDSDSLDEGYTVIANVEQGLVTRI